MLSQNDTQVNSIPIQEHHLRLDTIEAAAKAYFRAPTPQIKQEFLDVIGFVLPEGYTKYATMTGLIVERFCTVVTIRVEKSSESGLCPYCGSDILKARLCNQMKGQRWVESVVYCECGKFSRILERRAI
jgi:hypothetical protein